MGTNVSAEKQYKYQWQLPPDYRLRRFLEDPENQAKLKDGGRPSLTASDADWNFIVAAANGLKKQIAHKLAGLWGDGGDLHGTNQELAEEMSYEAIYRYACSCAERKKERKNREEKETCIFDRPHVAHIMAIDLQDPLSHALRRSNPGFKNAVVRVAPTWVRIFNNVTSEHSGRDEDLRRVYEAWDEMVDATTDKNKLLPKSDGTILKWNKETKTPEKSDRKAYRDRDADPCKPYRTILPKNARRNEAPVNGFWLFVYQFDALFPISFDEFAKRQRNNPAARSSLD